MSEHRHEKTVAPRAAQRNISRVAMLEAEFDENRTPIDRAISRIADWTGGIWFILIHIALFTVWITVNGTSVTPFRKYDPYPFVLLSVFVSCEAVLLSIIVLTKQNWMSQRDERRDQLNLQISLLAEQEVTKVLALQRRICEKLGIDDVLMDPEIQDLSQETAVEHLAAELGEAQGG